MATETLPITKTRSILDEMENVRNRIVRRAYEIFEANQFHGTDLDHWLQAERELLWNPAIELSEKDDEFYVSIALPGIDAKDLAVKVTPEHLLVTGETQHEHKEEKGKVHTCEFESGTLFRAIQFPRKVDPDKVQAQFKNGILSLQAPIAGARKSRKVVSKSQSSPVKARKRQAASPSAAERSK